MDEASKLVGQAITDHYESCLTKHKGDTALEVDWPTKESANKRYQVMHKAVTDHLGFSGLNTTLDFGCGTASMLDYTGVFRGYNGCDSSLKMVEEARRRHPGYNFYYQPVGKELEEAYDHVICCGVFTEKREASWHEMWDYTRDTLQMLLKYTKRSLVVNFMNSATISDDQQREELFFMPINATDRLLRLYLECPRYKIDTSYLPYEMCVTIYKGGF